MTHEWGFLNGYQDAAPGEVSCCAADPALELWRPFSGERWLFETKLETYMPYSNGRGFQARLYFGDGGPGTLVVALWRQRDVNQNWHGVLSYLQTGPRISDRVPAADGVQVGLPIDDGPYATAWFRVQRQDTVITVSMSSDGASWTTLLTHYFGALIAGKPQRLT